MMASPDLQRVYREHMEQVRRWGILAVLDAYSTVDPSDLATLEAITPQVTAIYSSAVTNALASTDEYMTLVAALKGHAYVADWRADVPDAPSRLWGGRSVSQWMSYAAPAVKGMIADGLSPAAALEISRARAAQQVASAPLQQGRALTFDRFVADGQRPGTPWERWRRVPSPGACDFCLMLATRSDYTSAQTAVFAGGEGSGRRYHLSCRCSAEIVAKGISTPVDRAQWHEVTRRDRSGRLSVLPTALPTAGPLADWSRAA